MKIDLIIKNAKVPFGDNLVMSDILISEGKIAGIVSEWVSDDSKVIDAEGLMVLPGCIDSHVHFMDPGFTHRETFKTGSHSAAAGGLTTVVDMPCCSIPSVRDLPSLFNKKEIIEKQSYIDFGMWGGVTGEDVQNGQLANVKKQAEEGVIGFKAYMTPSVPSYPKANDAELLEIFSTVASTGLPLGIHAENFTLCDYNVAKIRKSGRTDGQAWEEARNVLAEKTAIQMCLSFAEQTGARMHIVHLSSGTGATLIEDAKKRGLSITAETCPHYLILDGHEVLNKMGALAKIAPPIRIKEEGELLWEKVINGAIDFIATDHAPYEVSTEKMAEGMDIWTSFPGIPGVETMVPLMVSEGYNKGRISLSRLVDLLSKNAAVHYGLYPEKGSMMIGTDADFTFIDPDEEWVIRAEEMHTMAKYTPFEGMKLKGRVKKTMVRGILVYENDKICVEPGYGRFVRRDKITSLSPTITFHKGKE